jgi:hypothetical protein
MRALNRYFPALAFFAATLIPAVSCLYSPALSSYLHAYVRGGDVTGLEEQVRRSNPVWNGALDMYSTTLYRLGISSNPHAARIGQDGWVFLGNMHNENFDQAVRAREISDGEAQQWAEVLDSQRHWLESRNIPLLFVLAPMKANIYPEKLPRWAQAMREGKPSALDQFKKYAGDELLDVRGALIEAKASGLSYSKLNSHWTGYGAYAAWQPIARRLETELPGFHAYGTKPYTAISHVAYGNEFDGMVNIHVPNQWDEVSLSEPTPSIDMLAADGNWVSLNGNPQTDVLDLPRHTRNQSAPNKLRALVLRDSMGNSLSPYLQASFREVIQEHHHFYPGHTLNLPALIEKYRPDVVIYVMTERFSIAPLGNLYYWRGEEAFRKAAGAGDPMRVVRALGTLGEPAVLSLDGPHSSGSRTGVVRLRLNSAADGAVRLTTRDATQSREYFESVTRGANDLYFFLSESELKGSIDVVPVGTDSIQIETSEIKRPS